MVRWSVNLHVILFYKSYVLAHSVLQDDDQETILMPNKNGEKFLCYLPKVDKPKIGKPATTNISSLVVDTEKRIKLKTPDELLEVLKDRCLIRVRILLALPLPPDLDKINLQTL